MKKIIPLAAAIVLLSCRVPASAQSTNGVYPVFYASLSAHLDYGILAGFEHRFSRYWGYRVEAGTSIINDFFLRTFFIETSLLALFYPLETEKFYLSIGAGCPMMIIKPGSPVSVRYSAGLSVTAGIPFESGKYLPFLQLELGYPFDNDPATAPLRLSDIGGIWSLMPVIAIGCALTF